MMDEVEGIDEIGVDVTGIVATEESTMIEFDCCCFCIIVPDCLTSAVVNWNQYNPPILSPTNAMCPCLFIIFTLFLLIINDIPCSFSSADRLSKLYGISACCRTLDKRMLPRPREMPMLPQVREVIKLRLAT